jgi:ABC-type maltose transport system permease subunit
METLHTKNPQVLVASHHLQKIKQQLNNNNMKDTIKAILTHLCALVVVLLILGNIVQYVQCKVHLETVLYLQKEIQHQQELTIKVLDKVTDKNGYRKIE